MTLDKMKKTALVIREHKKDKITIGRGTDAIDISIDPKTGRLVATDATQQVAGHYPDMYPWSTPHKHPEEDTYKNFAYDLAFPPDDCPVSRLPMAIRELKRAVVGDKVVDGEVSPEASEGDFVAWDSETETFIPVSAKNWHKGAKLDVEDAEAGDVSQSVLPVFLGVVVGEASIQVSGMISRDDWSFTPGDPVYLSDTEAGKITLSNTGIFVGTAVGTHTVCLNLQAQLYERYIRWLRVIIGRSLSAIESKNEDQDTAIEALKEALTSISGIIEELSLGGRVYIVNSLAGRDALVSKGQGTTVYVKASEDSPAGLYILEGDATDHLWHDILSDAVGDIPKDFDWSSLELAVKLAHSHSNKEVLDKFGVSASGDVTWDGEVIGGSGSDINTLPSSSVWWKSTIFGVTVLTVKQALDVISQRDIDEMPTSGSKNFVTSGGVYAAIQAAIESLGNSFDDSLEEAVTNLTNKITQVTIDYKAADEVLRKLIQEVQGDLEQLQQDALLKSGGTMRGVINMGGNNITNISHLVFSNNAELWVE